MRISEVSVGRSVCLAALMLAALPLNSSSQIGRTDQGQSFNLFSPQQEMEIGRLSAAAVEKQLPPALDAKVDEYISLLGRILILRAPGERYPYSFKIANVSEVNAFAFPGGPIYVTRGAIEAARSEGELAGVLAHEIAHVALRHGASQASKAYLAQAGLCALGGLAGDVAVTDVIGAIGGFGFNTTFLKYNLEAESEADALAARIMTRAGYDPREMTSFFRTLHRRARGDVSKLQTFLGDHPSPESRIEQMDREAARPQPHPQMPQGAAGDFSLIQSYVSGLPRVSDVARLVRRDPTAALAVTEEALINQMVINVRAERPSPNSRDYWRRGFWFRVAYPENWRAYPSSDDLGVTFAPPGGIVEAHGQTRLVYGAVINRYKPIGDNSLWTGLAQRSFRYVGGRGELTEATNDLIDSVLQNNRRLDFARGSDRRGKNDGLTVITLTLTGRSPLTGRGERAQLYTRELDNGGIVYAIFVTPDDEYDEFRPAFERMLRGLKIDDGALQRDK